MSRRSASPNETSASSSASPKPDACLDSPEQPRTGRRVRAISQPSESDDAFLYQQTSSTGFLPDGTFRVVLEGQTISPDLSPNSRHRWRKINATTELRKIVRMAAISAQNEHAVRRTDGYPFTGKVHITATVYWEKARKIWDNTNLIIALKGAFDGLEDASLFENDRQVATFSVDQRRAPLGVPYLVLEVSHGTGS